MGTTKVSHLQARDSKTSTLGTKNQPFSKMYLASTIDISGSSLIITGSEGTNLGQVKSTSGMKGLKSKVKRKVQGVR